MKRLKIGDAAFLRRSSRRKPSVPRSTAGLHTGTASRSPDAIDDDDEDLGPRATDALFTAADLADLATSTLCALTTDVPAGTDSDARRLGFAFYDVPCPELADNLLGKVLVRRLENGTLLKGRIVETECYLGGDDKASMSHDGRMTERSKPMYMPPGTMFVYMTYGMYYMFNVSSRGPGAAVLLRALEPLEGHDVMQYLRVNGRRQPKASINMYSARLDQPTAAARRLKAHELCNGPAKLCTSLAINKAQCNAQDLTVWPGLWVEEATPEPEPRVVVRTSRIGIDSAGAEWAAKPLRYYLLGNKAVSKRDKDAEEASKTKK